MILASDSSGKVREEVSEAVVSDEIRAITADLSLSLRMISNLILFFPFNFPSSTGRVVMFCACIFKKALELFSLFFIAFTGSSLS